MKLRILALAAAASTVALVPAAHGVVKNRPLTTEPAVVDDVDVTITDSKIILSDTSLPRGDGVNFHVRNVGKKAHNFAILASFEQIFPFGLELLSTPMLKPNSAAAPGVPKGTWVLQVYMDLRGSYVYRSTAKIDRAKPGMHGKFTVT